MNTKVKFALIFMLVSLFLLPGTSFAAPKKDKAPPKLKNFVIYPTTINLGEEVLIGVKTVDKGSGVLGAGVGFNTPSGNLLLLDLHPPKKPSGKGWWTGSYVPDEAGEWNLFAIALADNLGNWVVYYDFPHEISTLTVNVPVSGVTLNKRYFAVKVDDSKRLLAIVQPNNATNKSVAWTSSNSNVAKVDANGVVTGLAVGTAVITTTTENGGFQATSEVLVATYSMPNYEYLRSNNYISGVPKAETQTKPQARYYQYNK